MSPLFSVEPLPTPVARWFAAFEEDPDSVDVVKVEDDGHRQFYDLLFVDLDEPDRRAGRVYLDAAGKCFYAYPSMHKADDESWKAQDYLRDYLQRREDMKEDWDKVAVIDRLTGEVKLWKILTALAFLFIFVGR